MPKCRKSVYTINWYTTLDRRSIQLGGFLQDCCSDKPRGRYAGPNVKKDACSVLLQVPTQDKDTFTVFCNGDFLGKMNVPCPDGLKVLKIPALGKHDINFESVADLIGEREGGRWIRFRRFVNCERDQLTSM